MSDFDDVQRAALDATGEGLEQFADVLAYCDEHSPLRAIAEAEGVDPAALLEEAIHDTLLIAIAPDGRLLRMDRLLDGVIFTHRLTAEEIEASSVRAVPDLLALDLDGATLQVDGTEVRFEPAPEGSKHWCWVGPPGWLASFAPDTLAAFRRNGDTLEVFAVDAPGPGDREASALADAFELEADGQDDIGVDPFDLVANALVEHPDLFRDPVVPVVELLVEEGIEVIGDWAGIAGEAWVPPGVAFAQDTHEEVVEAFDLDSCCVVALDAVIEAWYRNVMGEPIDARDTARSLSHDLVVFAFGEWVGPVFGLNSPRVRSFADLLDASGRRDSVGARVLRSLHHEAVGDSLAAERELEAAVAADPENSPALLRLADYASDRGDAQRTVSLLRRAGVPENDAMLSFHAGLLTPTEQHRAGRNDPCPCGSGKKFKQCHLGTPGISAGDRVKWLLKKIFVFLIDREDGGLQSLISTAALFAETDNVERFATDDFILELRMFEGGGIPDFLESRGPLLPDDEVDTLELWSMARLALWDIVEISGDTLTLLDTRSGERMVVVDRSASAGFTPGEQIVARVISGWGSTGFSGVLLRVDPRNRDSIIELLDGEPSALAIARWYGARHAPPRLVNREGEPLTARTARLRPTVPWSDVTALLDECYLPDSDSPGIWRETHDLDGDAVIRASIVRVDDELQITANSRERLQRVLDTVAAVTEVEEIFDSPTSSDAGREIDQPEPVELSDDDLEELQNHLEQRWLTENIPALGGRTPREAADDPTRRQDLIDLLRSFDRYTTPPNAITMRPDVLRRHLGLD